MAAQAQFAILHSTPKSTPELSPAYFLRRNRVGGINDGSRSGYESHQSTELQQDVKGFSTSSLVPSIVNEVLRSSGKSLDPGTRQFMESRFKEDLSRVRVHIGARAAESARAIRAKAYTFGNNIVFRDGQYTPHTDTGKRLLAHELAHAVQQKRAGPVSAKGLRVEKKDSKHEREASKVSQAILDSNKELKLTKNINLLIQQQEDENATTRRSSRHHRRRRLDRSRSNLSQAIAEFNRDFPGDFERLDEVDEKFSDLVERIHMILSGYGVTDRLFVSVLLSRHRASISRASRARSQAISSNFEPARLFFWLAHLQRSMVTMGPLLEAMGREAPDDADVAELPLERTEVANLIQAAMGLPSIRQGRNERFQEVEFSERSRRAEDYTRLTQQLLEHIRGNWSNIRSAPNSAVIPIERLMRRGLRRQLRISRNAVDEYLSELRNTNQQLWQFLDLIRRNPRMLQRDENDFRRAFLLAVGGEWADLVPQSTDEVAAGQLTGDTETAIEAEIAGTAADTLITMMPGLDQLGDVRDGAAHVFALLDVDGRHADEARSPLRWMGVVLTAIGLVPTLGSFLKGAGRIIVRLLGAGGHLLATAIRRIAGPVADFLRRYAPNVVKLTQRLLHQVSNGWNSISAIVRRAWGRLSGAVSRWLTSGVAGLTEFGRRMRRRWRLVRRAARQMIDPALTRLRGLLQPVFEAILDTLRRGGRAVVAAIPPRLRRFVTTTSERVRTVLQEGRRHLGDLRDMFVSPTRRMERLDEAMTELESVQQQLQNSIETGDTTIIERLSNRANELTGEIERRLSRSAGADVSGLGRGAVPRSVLSEQTAATGVDEARGVARRAFPSTISSPSSSDSRAAQQRIDEGNLLRDDLLRRDAQRELRQAQSGIPTGSSSSGEPTRPGILASGRQPNTGRSTSIPEGQQHEISSPASNQSASASLDIEGVTNPRSTSPHHLASGFDDIDSRPVVTETAAADDSLEEMLGHAGELHQAEQRMDLALRRRRRALARGNEIEAEEAHQAANQAYQDIQRLDPHRAERQTERIFGQVSESGPEVREGETMPETAFEHETVAGEEYAASIEERAVQIRQRLEALARRPGITQRFRGALQERAQFIDNPDLSDADRELAIEAEESLLSGERRAPTRDIEVFFVEMEDPEVRALFETTMQHPELEGNSSARDYFELVRRRYLVQNSLQIGPSTRSTDPDNIARTNRMRKDFMAAMDNGGALPEAIAEVRRHLNDAITVHGSEEAAVAAHDARWIDPHSGAPLSRHRPGAVLWPADPAQGAWRVDHIVELQHGGSDLVSNYFPVSQRMHSIKSSAMNRFTRLLERLRG